MYLEIFLADFVVFRVFLGISRKYLNFAGPRPCEISEALHLAKNFYLCQMNAVKKCHSTCILLFAQFILNS